jgi:hypothetical protein
MGYDTIERAVADLVRRVDPEETVERRAHVDAHPGTVRKYRQRLRELPRL